MSVNFIKKDNRGASLVELLVAFAVSAIVLSGIAYMLITSLRVSGKNNAEAQVQSEVQTAVNLLVDSLMEAEGICMRVSPSGGDTACILMGDTDIKKEGTGYTLYYKGSVLVAAPAGGNKELYLVEFPNEVYPENADGYCKLGNAASESECALAGLNNAEAYLQGLPAAERLRWLLGKDVISCTIAPESEYGEKTVQVKGTDVTRQYFLEPLSLSVSLKVERDYGNGTAEREIKDRITVRNRIDKIYITKKGMAEDNIEIYERER